MTSKDSKTKAQLAAEVEEKEQQIEELKARQANTPAPPVAAPSVNGQARLRVPGTPAPSPDGKTYFHAVSRSYRVPGPDGTYAAFEANMLATDDAELVAHLKKHPAFGREFWVSMEPTEPAETQS